ncbi:hypothetical protein [Nesterenkonia jeotgali]|uniref:hypothetical protein n=1 Tax=Nesterenkonia jeotgali TaxID=317018 RepID=UPI000AA4C2E7|nr:hypothetical protein [Nesterenkonia jeotgali]
MASTLHVVPLGDLIAHDISTDQADCICGPSVVCHQSPHGDNWQIIHVSLDEREKNHD